MGWGDYHEWRVYKDTEDINKIFQMEKLQKITKMLSP
jgi:hypothetical protein